jgi:membrane protein implicated in regulation of membrane protease activity
MPSTPVYSDLYHASGETRMTVAVVYFLCFAVGLGYAIVVGLTSHLFGGDGGDMHMDVGTDLPISPLSPTVLATFLTGFGGGGLLANSYFQISLGKGVLVALLTGLLLSAGTFGALTLLFRNTQAGSEYSISDMVGRVVQVITPIPERGTGEVAVIAKGTRIIGPARSADDTASPRNAAVEIVRVVGNVYHVRVVGQSGAAAPNQSA